MICIAILDHHTYSFDNIISNPRQTGIAATIWLEGVYCRAGERRAG